VTQHFEPKVVDGYSQEDVQQILQLAIARQTNSEELTRTQLVEIAQELGISLKDLHIAEQEWFLRRDEDKEQQAFNRFRRDRLKQQTVRFLIVNTFLVLLNLLTSGQVSWALYVVLSWGVLMALSAWRLLQVDGPEYEETFQNWRQRRQFKTSVRNVLNRWMRG